MTIIANVRSDLALFARLYSNGSKAMVIACVFAIGSGLFLTGAVIFSVALKPDRYAPILNTNPQQVTGPRVVAQGGVIEVTGTKCNTTDEAISITSESWFQRIDDRTQRVPRQPLRSAVREPGCRTTVYRNPIPDDLPPGTYQIQGSEVARSIYNQVQSTGWYSTEFTVVERAQ